MGAPWMATDFASGGTLVERVGLLSSLALRDLLLALLGALGHAHARGLVHRDLKPANVLYAGFPAVPKLADFGVAWARTDEAHVRPMRAATLAYMAPEQFTRHGAVEGPWTDLYQLGCVAWEVVTGEPPFATAPQSALGPRLARDLPTFCPRADVPEGLADWLATCLAADPAARFLDAADAAHGLRQLAWAPGPTPAPVLPRVSSTATTVPRAFDPSPVRAVRAPRRPVATTDGRPPLPSSTPALPCDGLGLMAWRPLGLAGLEGTLEGLVDRLRDVVASEGPGVVLVRDDGGAMATRAVEAFGALCAEHGLATVLHLPAGPDRLGRSAFDRAVPRTLGTTEPGDVGEALRTLGVDDNVLRAVWEDRLAARPPEGALSAFRHLLQRLAVHRPVVVVAEEAGWDDAPLGLAQNLLLRRRPLPVLLVVAVRVVPGDLPLPAIDALERAGASVLAVAPPSAVEARRALAHVAPVVHSALDALIGSAGGDPSVALARLGAFHRAGRVLATPKGLRLRPGSLAGAGAWDAGSRATALLERGGPQQRAQLGLLALLGPEVEVDWWRRASDRLGAGPVEGAIVEILADGLATLSPSGDLHVRTAAALAWSARAEERALAHEALASTAGAATPRVLHLLRAGRIEPCWEEIWDAVATATAQSVPRALLLLGEFEEAVRRGGIPDGHPRVLQVRRLEGRVFDSLGRLSQGLQRVGRLLEGARSHADAVGEADCLADQAHFEMRFGRVHRASALCDEATAAAERVGDADLRDRVRYRRAVLEVLARRAAVARPAIDGVRVSSHPYAQTRVHLLDGRLAWDSGDAIAARGHFEHALAAATRAGDARGVLMAELLLGGLAVAADDVLGARAWFRSAQRRSIAADDVASLARARAGLVRCALREDDEGAAERLLVPLAEKAAEGVDADLSILVAAAVAARHEDPPPEAWAVLERLEADGYADVEMADVLRIAARRAERAGAVARAHALLARAARHGTNPSQDRRELSRDAR